MSHVESGTSILVTKIPRVCREQSPALTVGVVLGLAQRITGKERDRAAEAIIESDEKLILIEVSTRLIPVNLTNISQRAGAEWIQSRD